MALVKKEHLKIILPLLSCTLACIQASDLSTDLKLEPFGEMHTMEKYIFSANREEYIYSILGNHLDLLYKEMELIEKFMKEYEDSSLKALKNAIEPLETPNDRGKLIGSSAVLSHLMTDRFVTVIDESRKLLKSKEYRESRENVEFVLDLTKEGEENGKKYNYKWPNEEDLYTSYVSILHMQETYGLSVRELRKGWKIESSFGGVLKALHCAKIGSAALPLGYYYMAIEWLEVALEVLSQDETDDSISKEQVQSLLDEAAQTHNNLLETNKNLTYEEYVNTYIKPTYAGQPANERRSGRMELYKLRAGTYGNDTDWEINNLVLCAGQKFQPIEIQSKMKCYLERKRHPYFILNPVKTEQLSAYPYIVQMYDVLGSKTIEEHYEIRRPFMKLSGVAGVENLNVKRKMRHRTSCSGTIPLGPFMGRIDKKAEMLTGMHLDASVEGLQVAEYTYGRFYGPHKDPLYNLELNDTVSIAGERLATLLFYLHEPEIGGYTSFTEVGVAGLPVKGSAVFWLNMYRNGSVRTDITHSACPVIHGHKIVFNRWIRYFENFQTFKCTLNPLD